MQTDRDGITAWTGGLGLHATEQLQASHPGHANQFKKHQSLLQMLPGDHTHFNSQLLS